MEVRIKRSDKRHGKRKDLSEVAIQFGAIEELNRLIQRLLGNTA